MRPLQRFCFVLLALLCPVSVHAQWVENGIPVCTRTGGQEQPRIVTDGAGGAIVVWADASGGYLDIYAQRISADGTVLWQAGGVTVCAADYDQTNLEAVSDGAGGALVAWQDFRMGMLTHHRYQYKIFAQRIGPDGSMLWVEGGLPVCTIRGNQRFPALCPDGTGGAVVAWFGSRDGTPGIYAQRVTAAGMPAWQSQGVPLCTGTWMQFGSPSPEIAPDGYGGAVVVWEDYRNDTDYEVCAQRIGATGVRFWEANGISVSAKAENQIHPYIAHDGAGGWVVVWRDGNAAYDVFAQRILGDGTHAWQAGGVGVSTASGDQYGARVVPDEAGGSIIAWRQIGGTYAQRLTEDGASLWRSSGVMVPLLSLAQEGAQLIGDGEGGALVAGYDVYSTAHMSVMAQKIDADGEMEWHALACEQDNMLEEARLTLADDGGAFLVWRDYRDDEGDIYAARVFPPIEVFLDIRPGSCPNPFNPRSNGVLPAAICGTPDLDVSQIDAETVRLEGVAPLRWNIEDVTGPVEGDEWCACEEHGPDGIMDLVMKFSVPDLADAMGNVTGGQTVELSIGGSLRGGRELTGGDCVVIRGERPTARREEWRFLGLATQSSPADPVQRISYYLPERSVVRAAVYDVSGRLVVRFEELSVEAGLHTMDWDAAQLPSGVYFLRVSSGDYVETVKVILIR